MNFQRNIRTAKKEIRTSMKQFNKLKGYEKVALIAPAVGAVGMGGGMIAVGAGAGSVIGGTVFGGAAGIQTGILSEVLGEAGLFNKSKKRR